MHTEFQVWEPWIIYRNYKGAQLQTEEILWILERNKIKETRKVQSSCISGCEH